MHSPHSIYVADMDDHTVRTFNPDGESIATLGTVHQAGAPGMPFITSHIRRGN